MQVNRAIGARESGGILKANLLREPNSAHQLSEPGIGTQGIKLKVGPDPDQAYIVFLIGSVEPPESLILVAQLSVQSRNRVCGQISFFALCQP